MKILYILFIILFVSCSGTNSEPATFEQCLTVHDKENCLIHFFSTNAPFYNKEDGKDWERLIIKDPKDIIILCNELYVKYDEDQINLSLFTAARYNKAYCLCDYINYKINLNDSDSPNYLGWRDELCTGESSERLSHP